MSHARFGMLAVTNISSVTDFRLATTRDAIHLIDGIVQSRGTLDENDIAMLRAGLGHYSDAVVQYTAVAVKTLYENHRRGLDTRNILMMTDDVLSTHSAIGQAFMISTVTQEVHKGKTPPEEAQHLKSIMVKAIGRAAVPPQEENAAPTSGPVHRGVLMRSTSFLVTAAKDRGLITADEANALAAVAQDATQSLEQRSLLREAAQGFVQDMAPHA